MKTNVESNGGEVFTQTGGYRVGRNAWLAFNASWPFGSCAVRPGEFTLYCVTRRLIFPKASVTRISVFEGMFSEGIRIEHTIPEYPQFVVFWSSSLDSLRRELSKAGFPEILSA